MKKNDIKIINAHCKITPEENMQFNKISIKAAKSKLDLYNEAIKLGLETLKKNYKLNKQ